MPAMWRRLDLSEYPALEPLTGGERRRFLDAFFKNRPAGRSFARFSTACLSAAAFIVVASLVGTCVLALPLGVTPNGLEGVSGIVIASIAVVVAVLCGAKAAVRFGREVNRFEHSGRLREYFDGPRDHCAGCDYCLTGVEEPAGRAGVARCPECGLVSPAPRQDSSGTAGPDGR